MVSGRHWGKVRCKKRGRTWSLSICYFSKIYTQMSFCTHSKWSFVWSSATSHERGLKDEFLGECTMPAVIHLMSKHMTFFTWLFVLQYCNCIDRSWVQCLYFFRFSNAVVCVWPGITSVPHFEFSLKDNPHIKHQFSGAQQVDTFVSVFSRLKMLSKV